MSKKERKTLIATARKQKLIITAVIISLLALTTISIISFFNAKKQKDDALLAQRDAERSDSIAQVEKQNAIDEKGKTAEALLKAERARLAAERSDSNAQIQTAIAIREKNNAQRQTFEAKVTALAAKAREAEDTDPTLAYNMAMAAYQQFNSPETRSAFHDIASRGDIFYKRVLKFDKAGVAIAFSPDGKYIPHGIREWECTTLGLTG